MIKHLDTYIIQEMQQGLRAKDLLGLKDISQEEIEILLDTAFSMKEVLRRPIKKIPTLRGKTVCFMFFEPSTRTRSSFELAAKRLSADTISISSSQSALLKGETVLDTMLNIDAMGIDAFVVRHASSGLPYFLAKHTKASVINAGDGMHEHPTQALLDMMTIKERFGRLKGIKVLIVGDVMHSRVARSNIYGLLKMGAEVRLFGPPTLVPRELEKLGARVFYNKEKAIEGVNVIIGLRIQKERLKENFFPSIREYRKFFGIGLKDLKGLSEDVLIMHPGPVNWGVEMDYDLVKLKNNVILEQVTNGVAIRMSVLYHLISGEG